MKTISDDELVLLYYGEHDDPNLAFKVAEDSELSRRFDALSAQLKALDTVTPPERSDSYGAEVWVKLGPQLEPSSIEHRRGWFSALSQPRFSLAGVFSIVIIAGVAFMLGRSGTMTETPDMTPQTMASNVPSIDSKRLLTRQVSGHLDSVEVMLTQFVNAPANGNSNTNETADWAMNMLVTNRLYRRSAEATGNRQLAGMLAELEPLLLELAHQSYQTSPSTHERLRNEVKDNLLFKVRVTNNDLSTADDPV